jgi:hypothetical protein
MALDRSDISFPIGLRYVVFTEFKGAQSGQVKSGHG